jgi:hypothetical protein
VKRALKLKQLDPTKWKFAEKQNAATEKQSAFDDDDCVVTDDGVAPTLARARKLVEVEKRQACDFGLFNGLFSFLPRS